MAKAGFKGYNLSMRRLKGFILGSVLMSMGIGLVQTPLSLVACETASSKKTCCCPSDQTSDCCPIQKSSHCPAMKSSPVSPFAVLSSQPQLSFVVVEEPLVVASFHLSIGANRLVLVQNLSPPPQFAVSPASLRAPPYLA
jgi:hypothetical protein